MNRLGIQLYTVRREIEDAANRAQVFAKLKAAGCDTVQLYGGADLLAAVAPDCIAHGLTIIGWLGDLDTCERDAETILRCAGNTASVTSVSVPPSAPTKKPFPIFCGSTLSLLQQRMQALPFPITTTPTNSSAHPAAKPLWICF